MCRKGIQGVYLLFANPGLVHFDPADQPLVVDLIRETDRQNTREGSEQIVARSEGAECTYEGTRKRIESKSNVRLALSFQPTVSWKSRSLSWSTTPMG